MSDATLPTKTDRHGVTDRWLTIPNALCMIRLVGSFVLVPIALCDFRMAFLWTFLLLTCTDWFDGKIARYWNQKSRIGPALDSLADVSMYAALLFGIAWLFVGTLLQEILLFSLAVTTYIASCSASLLKFHRFPSYHTLSAKVSWFLVLAAVVALFLDWSVWPLRIAAIGVIVANVEATLITLALKERRHDVPTLFHAVVRPH